MDEQDDNGIIPENRSLAVKARSLRTIIVNGREHAVEADTIDRDDIARLAFPGTDANRGALTVTYDNGPVDAPSGLIPPGRPTRILQGQTFSVSLTDKS